MRRSAPMRPAESPRGDSMDLVALELDEPGARGEDEAAAAAADDDAVATTRSRVGRKVESGQALASLTPGPAKKPWWFVRRLGRRAGAKVKKKKPVSRYNPSNAYHGELCSPVRRNSPGLGPFAEEKGNETDEDNAELEERKMEEEGGETKEANDFLQFPRCIRRCDEEVIDLQYGEDLRGSWCAVGHILCPSCTTRHVENTLLPKGVVWWDTISCADPGCTEYMDGVSVRRCLSQRLVERIDAFQLDDVVSMTDAEASGERARAAEATRQYPRCTLECDNGEEDLQGSWCALGHFLCPSCTTQHIENTLTSHGVVWWDTINCVDSECTGHMEGVTVRHCLPQRLVERIDASQLDVVSMTDAEDSRERARAAEAARQYPRCILECGDDDEDLQGSWCPLGHFLCPSCTTQYVEKTLLPQGVMWWDTINCVDSECTEHMEGASVRRCLSAQVVERIDASQLETVSMIEEGARRERERERERAAEAARRERDVASRAAADRASEAMVAQSTKPCPRCGAPSVKVDGCKHINKCRCGFEYCWDCGKSWVRGHLSVSCATR